MQPSRHLDWLPPNHRKGVQRYHSDQPSPTVTSLQGDVLLACGFVLPGLSTPGTVIFTRRGGVARLFFTVIFGDRDRSWHSGWHCTV